MLETSKFKNEIIVKQNKIFLIIGVVAIIMAIQGIRLIFGLLPFEEGYTFVDVFGLVFVLFWVIVVLSMGIFTFEINSKKITINTDGVLCVSWFRKKFIKWTDVKDWGLSYCGQTRGEGNTYYLYFAEHVCRTKNECKKKLKGKMIKTIVISEEYSQAVSEIIHFCEDKTNVEPFIRKDKYHFI